VNPGLGACSRHSNALRIPDSANARFGSSLEPVPFFLLAISRMWLTLLQVPRRVVLPCSRDASLLGVTPHHPEAYQCISKISGPVPPQLVKAGLICCGTLFPIIVTVLVF